MAGYVAPYTYNGITYNRGDALVVNGNYYSSINSSGAGGSISNQVKYFYGVYVNDDGTLPEHPLGLMNSSSQSSVQFAHMNLDAIVAIGTTIITPGPFKAYSYDTRTKKTLEAGNWFEAILLDFNSFSSPESDPIVGYNLYYYQSKGNSSSNVTVDSEFTGPYLIGTITGQKILGNVNEDVNASSWGDRGYWFKWGLQAVTQNGSKSLIYDSDAFRKSFAYLQVFNGNGNTGGDVSDFFQFSGYPFSMPNNGFIKKGHTFAGWAESSSGSGTIYYEGQNVNVDAIGRNWWARWTVNKYKLTINPNTGLWNGSENEQSFIQNYNTTKTISNPTKTGHTFAGWTLAGKGSISGTVYRFGDGDGVLTAKWVRTPCVIVFDASTNGGTPDSKKAVFYGDKVGTLPTPNKKFYKFVGWFTKASGGTQISASQVITSNVTYYAQFKIDASVKISQYGDKTPAIVWVGKNGVWSKVVAWVGEKGIWNKSTGAD